MTSRIGDIKQDKAKLVQVLAEYEEALSDVENILRIQGKKLEHANRENPTWQLYFDQRRIELKTLLKYYESEVNRVRGRLFVNFTEKSNIDLSDRAKEKYIDNEKGYLDVYEIYLEIEEMYNKYQAVVDAFTSRGYALNNITKIRVAALEDSVV